MRRAYTHEEFVTQLRALAAELGHTPMVKDYGRSGRRPCYATILQYFGSWDAAIAGAGLTPILPPAPGWQSGAGRRTYWTEARIIAGLRLFADVHGAVPASDKAYNRLKKDDLRFPTAARVYALGRGEWWRALKRAGLPYRKSWATWRRQDDDLLLELAGTHTLKEIAARLGRSWPACKRRLYDLGTRARDAQGYLTGQQLAAEYGVSVATVYRLVDQGRIRALRRPGVPYLQIDPDSAARCTELRALAAGRRVTRVSVARVRRQARKAS